MSAQVGRVTAGPLARLLQVSLLACDALKPMISQFYASMSRDTSKLKADASVFTIADGLVQHLLVEHLFAGGKFAAIVGEEECAVSISSGAPFTVDDLVVPDEFCATVEAVAREIRLLSAQLEVCDEYRGLTIFIDPIDGTREFSTGLGEQSTVCIGFADAAGQPVAGLVYRPIPTPATWAAGAQSEGVSLHNLDMAAAPTGKGLLTSNGGISPFISSLFRAGGLDRVPSGGAGNKMLMLLEGKGAAYIQDRGVSRWDTCGAQAVLQAHGGHFSKLTNFLAPHGSVPVRGYTYLESAANLDFEPGTATLTPYNAIDKTLAPRGTPPAQATEVGQVKPYANLCGHVALASSAELDKWRQMCLTAAAENAPDYD